MLSAAYVVTEYKVTAITISAILKDFPTVNIVFPMFVLCLFMMHVVQS
ncbi:hypothetical protein M087_2949 [Bacteroides fragilis str. S23 R14]|nr:hypothetical protein M087_2949 [Bacteroides fragilis str. S23 R14]EYE43607.1 hypothetical protein M138_2994 [Bacteroides fragilis str. S23L17]